MAHISMHTPVADLTLFEDRGALVAVEWGWTPQLDFDELTENGVLSKRQITLLEEAKKQLDAYFDGDLTTFDLPLNPYGTDQQITLWQHLQQIPYGETRTIAGLAKDVGLPLHTVMTACEHNPLPIIVPCHRLVHGGEKSSETWLGDFAGDGGHSTKAALLTLEEVLEPDYS